MTDDGAGFDPSSGSNGFGLAGLRDRLALVGGGLSVLSAHDGGTTLTATLPLAELPESDAGLLESATP